MNHAERAISALDGLPRLRLGEYPTPVSALDLADIVPGFRGRAWVKREDASAPELGGNKVRKLEYLLGAAQASGSRTLVAVGGIGSNHCLATAYYAPEAGLETHLHLFPHHATGSTRRTLRAICALGPVIRTAPTANLAGAWAAATAVQLRARGRRPFVVLPGGSSPTGVLGAVRAGLELATQIDAGELEAPDAVYCAYGSGGTAAGLALGLQLGGHAPEVVAVRVYPMPTTSQAWLRFLARRARTILQRAADGPLPRFDAQRLVASDGYLGAGYTEPTPEGSAAREAAATLGITLEMTYTAKAFAAFLDAAGGARRQGRLLFHLTYDPRIPGGLQEPLPPELVPKRLREYV
jgi:D-cysteine desulfhydrase